MDSAVLLAGTGIGLVVAAIIWIAMATGFAEKRRFGTAKRTAEAMIADVSANSDSAAFMWLRAAGWAVSPFVLPVGAAAVVAGNVALAAKRGLNLRKARMPDSWYDQVVNEASHEGQIFLGSKLKAQGYISVAQAARWLEIEEVARLKSNPSKAALLRVAAAQAKPKLLERMKARLKDTRHVA